MTGRKVSHTILALTALLSSAAALPFAQGLMGMYGLSGLGRFHPGRVPNVGHKFSCLEGYSRCSDSGNAAMAYEPDKLVALTRTTNALNEVTGLVASITEEDPLIDNGMYGGKHGFGSLGSLGGYGFGHGFGGYGGGIGGGYGGYGGGIGGGFGGYGGGHHGMDDSKLNLHLEVTVGTLAEPIEVMLVFTAASDPDSCDADSVGPVLTGPSEDSHPSHGMGYGGRNMMLGYMSMGSQISELDFGVISTLTINSGRNTFQISGLGDFKRLRDLAGRGISLCEDVTISSSGKPMCSGNVIGVLQCGRLGFSVNKPELTPP